MNINDLGIELIKKFEGCRLKAYKDAVGVLTVGYGHTGDDVSEGLEIDPGTANELLERDLQRFQEGVEDMLEVEVNSNQFSALVSFAYNVGLMALEGSTLLRKLNSGDVAGVGLEFLRWSKAGGKTLQGLYNRRVAEKTLFETPVA